MIGGNVHARVSALIAIRPALSPREWKQAVEEFRIEFFGRKHRALPFPAKLHMVASCESLDDVFWLHDGKSFAVNRDGYKRNIMSVFFDQHKLKSFQNRLSAYKFRAGLSMGRFPDDVAHNFLVYRHPSFVRDEPGASLFIRAPKSPSRIKGGATKAALNESSASRRSEGRVKVLIDMSLICNSDRTLSETQQEDELLRELGINTSGRTDSETADCCSVATFSMSSGSGDL